MKRIISLLLVLLLVFALLPGQSFAARNSVKAIQLVKNGGTLDNLPGAQANSLWFGGYTQSRGRDGQTDPVKWRLLDNAEGQLLLLADQNLDARAYHTEAASVAWADSAMRSWLNDSAEGFIGKAFTKNEAAALAETTPSKPRGENSTEQVFLLSAEEAQNAAYGFADDASRKAQNTGYAAGQGSDGSWWLRTQGEGEAEAYVDAEGAVVSAGKDVTDASVGVRPAVKVSLSSVLFASAVEGGKGFNTRAAGTLQKIGDYSGNEWKLTLLDETRDFRVTETQVSGVNGQKIELNYTGATPNDAESGSNEYISGMIVDNSGTPLFYGRLAQPSSSSGTLEINLPSASELPAGSYNLVLFSEQVNGGKLTDYASAFSFVNLTIAARTYTITFLNEDGTMLAQCETPEGESPVYPGEKPTKDPTDQYTYTFANWNPPLAPATGDTTYRATYTETLRSYTIRFVNENGQILQEDYLAYGASPEYTGPEPTKDRTAQYTYTFAGWDKKIADVTGPETYTATYTSTVNQYTIRFLAEDGTELQSSQVPYGESPKYNGELPTKEPTEALEYSFAGWDPPIDTVFGDADYTATFTSAPRKYKIWFKNYDLEDLLMIEVPYGEKPEYVGETPTKPATEDYTYTFAGWAPELEEVTHEMTYVATYTEKEIVRYTVTQGADGSWVKGSTAPHMITVKRSPNDENCFSHYQQTLVDGEPVTVSAKSGSTVITFSADVLNKLGIGPHTVTVKFDDGEVETQLSIKSTDNSGSGGSGSSGGSSSGGSPHTGGKALDVCIGLAVVAGLGLGVLAIIKLRRRNQTYITIGE